MCQAAPVAERARADVLAAIPNTHDLGIVRDPGRCAERRSAHCCGDRAENPAARNSNYVHAWDCGHAVGDRATAAKVRDLFLADPRVDYVISFGVLYKPDGEMQGNTGHEDHVHVTFDPSSTHDTRPFTTATTEDIDIMDADTRAYFDAKFITLTAEIRKVKDELAEQAKRHNTAERKRDAEHAAGG